MATSVSLLNYPDLGEKVYEIVREEILTGQLRPGTPLPVVAVAQRLGVSRTPVKDALSRLAAEGLAEEVARKGYFVTKLDAEDIVDLQEARLMIELAAVRRGIERVAAADLAAMRRLLAEMDTLVGADGHYVDHNEYARRDSQFHLLVVGTAGNRHLMDVFRRLSVHLHIFRMSLSAHETNRRSIPSKAEHEAIVAALEAGDLAALETALQRHVRGVIDHVRSAALILGEAAREE